MPLERQHHAIKWEYVAEVRIWKKVENIDKEYGEKNSPNLSVGVDRTFESVCLSVCFFVSLFAGSINQKRSNMVQRMILRYPRSDVVWGFKVDALTGQCCLCCCLCFCEAWRSVASRQNQIYLIFESVDARHEELSGVDSNPMSAFYF